MFDAGEPREGIVMLLKKSFFFTVFLLSLFIMSPALYAATPVYRSIGPEMNGPLATGSSNLLTITGTNAGFTFDLPGNVGVGDIIVYDSNNDSLLDARAFIQSRSVASVFIVQDESGGTPVATVFPDENWQIYRSYTSLFEAECGSENMGIPTALRNFDATADGWNLISGNRVLHLACYADAADNTPVVFAGASWTTDATHYVRIFTPKDPTEVGISQRHDGKWNNSAYRMITNDATCIYFQIDYFRIEGLQFNISTVSSVSRKCVNLETPGTSEIYISHSIFSGTATDQNMHAGITLYNSGNGLIFVWNNIFYNFDRSGTNWVAALEIDDSQFTAHILNNTFVDSYRGLQQNSGIVYAMNNIAQGCSDGFSGIFDVTSDYNLSDLSGDAPGPNALNNSIVAFADYPGRDFHLAPGDISARDNGMNLSGYTPMPFTDDIDREIRSINWDIGADEEYPIPTPTPTVTVSFTPTLSPTVTASASATPSPTFSPTVTVSASATPSPTFSSTPISPMTATDTPTPLLTSTDTPTLTETPDYSPTITSTVTPYHSSTQTPSITVTSVATSTSTAVPEPSITSVRIRNNVIKAGGNQGMAIDVPLDHAQHVSIRIYNQRGELMTVISDQEQESGIFQAVWQGKNASGSPVRSGVYLIYIKTDNINLKKKVAVIR